MLEAGQPIEYIASKVEVALGSLNIDRIKLYFSELSSFFDIIFYAIGILPIYRMMVKKYE